MYIAIPIPLKLHNDGLTNVDVKQVYLLSMSTG